MALSDAYLNQVKNLSQILQAIRQAQPPERFSHKFLAGLDFKSTNDRGIIGVLKAFGFIDESGAPKQPYFDYLDDEQHKVVLAEGIRQAYADLFKLNNKANEKDSAWVKNKLKTLTQGSKSEPVLTRMTATFIAFCKEADFPLLQMQPKRSKPKPRSKHLRRLCLCKRNLKVIRSSISSRSPTISTSNCRRFETKLSMTQSSNLDGT